MKVVLLIQLLLYTAVNCQLVFKDSPATATVLVNYPTTLRCSAYEPNPPANILWLKDGVISESDPRGRVNVTYNPATGRSEYVIHTVSYLDNGNYECFAVNATDSILASSSTGTLTVQGQPGFATPLPSVTVPLGETAVFECLVLSNPSANVSWSYQDEFPISLGGRFIIFPATTLTITNVQASDERFYVCNAVNTFGRNTTSARLTIGTPPPELNPVITPGSPDPLVLNLGDSLSLSCSVTPGTVFTSMTWTRGPTPITDVAQTSTTLLLSMASVQFEDGGVYTCTVTDEFGDTESVSRRVEVDVPPQFLTTPQDLLVTENVPFDVTSTCAAVGEPDPLIIWLRADGTQIPIMDGEPQFGVLTRSDAGVFACIASNSAGEIRYDFTVTVQGSPVFSVPPTNIEAAFGQDVVFQCVAEGPPEPSHSWTRVGGSLPDGSVISADSTRLHLFSVTVEDEGTYQCEASNLFGAISGQASLQVFERPQILEATMGPLYFAIGTSFSLDCVFSGPDSTVQIWTLNGVTLLPSQDVIVWPNGTLTVNNPREQYSGEYVCNATTSFAFDLVQISVFVGSPPEFTVPPSDIDLLPGARATIPCMFSGQPEPWSMWFKTDNFGVRRELPTQGPTFTKLSTGLELRDVSREDSGVYECMLDNGIGTQQQSATVRVEGLPLATGISPVELVAGSTNVTLECTSDFNYPSSTVTWERIGEVELPAGRFNVTSAGELVISVVVEEDQGEYACILTNVYGASSITATVMVFVTPSISFPSPEVIATVLSQLSIPCPATGSPTPSVEWFLEDGSDANTAPALTVNTEGVLIVSNASPSDEAVLTCVATNRVGVATADIQLLVRGPQVVGLSADNVGAADVVVRLVWSPPPPIATLQSYELEYGRPGRQEGRVTETTTQTLDFVLGLLPGTLYEFIVRGNFAGGLIGEDSVVMLATPEAAPTGPPQNITVNPLGGGFYVIWTLPLEEERSGVIVSYRISYRRTPSDPTLDPPFFNVTYMRNVTEDLHSFTVLSLDEMTSYQVKLLASTAVGDGPESSLFPVTTTQVINIPEVDLQVVVNAVIGVLAAVIGVLLLVAIAVALYTACTLCWRRVRKFGKHKPLTEEEAYDRQRTGQPKSISGPIPGITPKFDNSVDGKFTVQGEGGRVLNLKPKVITSEDVATPPREGEKVKVVPSDEILVSQGGADAYNQPADALDGSWYNVPRSQPYSRPSSKPVIRPESGIYSEVHVGSRLPEVTEETDSGLPQDVSFGREAAEEPSETNLLEGGASEPEVIVVQPPSPERRGPEGEDTGRDTSQLIYASVSEDHKQKKREKMTKEQEQQEAKRAKQERKMQEKMEREQKKQEQKRLKQEEKERKKRAKDQQLRSSLGLDNVVHLHELDLSKKDARAQAQFIDAATAALF